MRRFVAALKTRLATLGCRTDDDVFEVLKFLSVVFDYARPNSIAEHHDRMRAKQLATGTNRDSLYDVLFGLILRSDAIGGETSREDLKAALREHGIEIGASLNLAKARERIEELSRFALRDIQTTVNRQRLARVRAEDDDDTDLERTWTRTLFECAATRAKSWTNAERDALVFDMLDQFSDEAFIDTAAAFLVKSDLTHIEGDAAATQYLVDLRTRLWARLKTALPWQHHCRSPRGGLEIHLNDLILAFFCKVAGLGHHTSYTKGLTDDQIVPFLPVLTEMAVTSAPCPSIARLLLDLLELIDPQKAEPYLLSAAVSWLAGGDQRFWNELGIGQRVCALLEKAAIQASAHQWIEIADVIAAAGVAAGETLKQALRARQ